MEQFDVVVIGAGQSGLAAAHALRRQGLAPVVLEASGQPAGSWPRYYDSLTLFSPARYSSLPGLPFGGDPDHYPHRDEVVDYLLRCADRLDAEIRTRSRVRDVRADGEGFAVTLEGGRTVAARAVVATTGGFGRPHRPESLGLEEFTGQVLHAAGYCRPEPFAGQHVAVVGAGNSAVQIAVELATRARVTLATRTPVRFVPQRPLGRDIHFWFTATGIDTTPVGRFVRTPPTAPVFDTGYRAAVRAAAPRRRPVFAAAEGSKVTWPDGVAETVDAIVLATGYRPDLGYLAPLGALDASGHPLHRDGASAAHPGLAYVGLEWQRSLSSASLRGVGRDATRAARRLAAWLRRGA